LKKLKLRTVNYKNKPGFKKDKLLSYGDNIIYWGLKFVTYFLKEGKTFVTRGG
jgi:hypothetical protein